MRVLQVHNRYRSDMPSGENAVVDAEAELLSAAGVDVIRHIRSSDEIDTMSTLQKAALPLRPFYSPSDVAAVTGILRRSRPDLMHVHNPNPLVSLSVVRAAARHRVPVVMTTHNHRHTCVKGTFRRDDHDCHDCEGRTLPWPAVVHSCYRDSRAQSLVIGSALVAHRSSYARVSRFIAISTAMRHSLLRSGVSADRIVVKPNSVPDPGPSCPEVELLAQPRFLFVGRLEEEKGVQLLLDAWAKADDGSRGHLTLVGAGRLEPVARVLASRRDDLTVTGQVPPGDVGRLIGQTSVVVVPSLWEEPFGLVVLEAYARKRPVLSTGAGGLGDLLSDTCSWRVGPDVDAWAQALRSVTTAEAAEKGRAARAVYTAGYTPAAVTGRLVEIYADVLHTYRGAPGPDASGSAG